MSRSREIQIAASLPVGHTLRRQVLATLARDASVRPQGAVVYNRRRGSGTLQVFAPAFPSIDLPTPYFWQGPSAFGKWMEKVLLACHDAGEDWGTRVKRGLPHPGIFRRGPAPFWTFVHGSDTVTFEAHGLYMRAEWQFHLAGSGGFSGDNGDNETTMANLVATTSESLRFTYKEQ